MEQLSFEGTLVKVHTAVRLPVPPELSVQLGTARLLPAALTEPFPVAERDGWSERHADGVKVIENDAGPF